MITPRKMVITCHRQLYTHKALLYFNVNRFIRFSFTIDFSRRIGAPNKLSAVVYFYGLYHYGDGYTRTITKTPIYMLKMDL